MRRSGFAAVITGALLVVACSEQPTAPTERTIPPDTGPSLTTVCSTQACIQTLINALFKPGDNLKSANDLWTNVKTKFAQGAKGLTAAQAKATDLVTYGLKLFYAGKLIGGTSPTTQAKLADLSAALSQYVGGSGVPIIPAGSLGSDGAAVIITPQSPTTLVITGTEQAGILIPAGAAPTTTLVSIVRLPDSPGPLRTSLDQYPLFYHFSSSPEVTFNVDVTGGICQSQTLDINTLRLAHNVGPNFGDVEILPFVNAPFLDCSNLAGPIGTRERGGLFGLASAGWSLLGRTVGPVATAIFLPDELHAAALETCCLGGTTKKFSEFGAVNPGSNPASLNYNPNAATFNNLSAAPSGTVTPAPSVVVKSQNGTPIANVPVVFAVGEGGGTVNGGSTATVNTNSNGIATVTTWVLGATPGTYTLSATPPAVTQVGTTPPFKPAAVFSPTSLPFTAVVEQGGDIIVINDMNMLQNDVGGTNGGRISTNFYNGVDPVDNVRFFENVVSYSNSGPRGSQKGVLFHRGHDSQCGANECAAAQLTTLYDALSGIGFTAADVNDGSAGIGTIASNVKVIFLMTPRTNYSAAEVTTLNTFLAEGGRLFFVGENPNYYGDNVNYPATGFSVENDLLQQMGKGLQVSPTLFAACDHSADRQTATIPAAHIASLPVTSGVSTLSIPCAARLLLSSGDILIADDIDGFPAAAFATGPSNPIVLLSEGAKDAPQSSLLQSRIPATRAFVRTDRDGTGLGR